MNDEKNRLVLASLAVIGILASLVFIFEPEREIFYHPEELKDSFFAENFVLEKKFEVKPEETYEREGAEAVLLVRK